MKRRTLKLFALLLAMIMVLALLPTAALAEGESSDQVENVPPSPNGYVRSPEHGTRAVSDAYARGDMETYYQLKGVESTRDTLPSSYDSRNYNYITSVKNQNPYGSCWAHAAMASVESYMIKHGVEVGSTGAAATTSLNLSETQHCYFNYSTAYDAEGMLTGDKCTLLGSDSCLDAGGNGEMSAYTLQRWCGSADESAATALQYSKASTVASSGLSSQYSYNYNISHVQNSEWIPATDIEGVKRAIMSYGAGNISYYAGDSNYTYNCTIDTSSQESSSHKWANHAITLVGWDDSIAASQFSPNRPSGNGAWLCKNSWGTSYFNQGYMYISYEDTSVLEGYIFFYDAEPIDNYDHNYQYDGSCNVVCYGKGWNNSIDYYEGFANDTKVANVFTANGSEMLKAVALCNWDEALSYTVEIYKNPTTGNPSSGTLMSTQSGTLTYSGYYTIVLDTPVLLNAGDTFSVVFTQHVPEADDNGKYVHTPYDATFKNTDVVSWASWTHTNHGNTSYYQEPNGAWTDCPENGDYRIKAYTVDYENPYTVTAVSNNSSYGTVSVTGTVITATPADGYYVESAEVISGTATVSVSGNTVNVSPESDCEIRVNFAPKPSYTVDFVAVDNAEGSETAYLNDAITLPSSVSVSVYGWTFVGWVDAELAETSEKPAFYAPGESYTVTANATLYALYTCEEEGTGAPVYELLTAAPSDWSGNYVITNSTTNLTTSGMYVLKGVTGSSAGTNAETSSNCTAFANTGITLTDNVLSGVVTDYVFALAAEESYYTIQSASIGSYFGMNSSSYLYAYSGYNATYCNWTPAINSSGVVQLKNAANGSYPYFSWSTSNSYFWSGSSNNSYVLRLWKEINGNTLYYATSPVALHEHAYGPWTSNGNGTHSCTCSECGNVVTEDCTYNDVVTDPTTTEQGYTTHTCTVCGYSYVDSYVDPLLYALTAVSNNTDWGTVSVSVYTITATPAAGCYLSGYEITSGTATATVDGNTITVTPESDCTVTVIFAPIPTYTVTYISTGASAGSATGYIDDVINLPTSVSNEPDDWTFIGWMGTKLDETTEKPAYYAPGADYTITGDVTLYALFTRAEGTGGDIIYQLTDDLAVGGRYVITNYTNVGEYAVGNIIDSTSNHYLNALSVTVDGDTLTVPSGVDVDTILYEIESGDTSSGWVFRNVEKDLYMSLDASEYITLNGAPLAWLYDYSDSDGYYYLDNQIDSEGYYYLSLDTTNYRFTTSKATKDIRMYQEINAAVNYYTTDPVAAVGLVVTIASGDAAFEYDGTLKTNHQYTVTVEGEAVEADETGLTFTLPTGDILTITPADTAAVTHVKEGAVENAFTWSFDGNEDQYFVLETYGTLTVTPHAITLTVVGNHATVVYNGKSQNVKGWTLECDDDLFWSAREASSIIENLDPPVGEKAWMAVGTEPGTYYMNIDVSGAYLKQVDTSETAAHFVDDFAPTWEVVDGYLVILPDEPAFKSQSLLLEGDIGVRFYVYLPESLRVTTTNVSFTISGKNGDSYATTVPFSEDLPTNSKGYYGFTFYVNTIQMADTITATLHYGDGETLEKTYSLVEYFAAFDADYAENPGAYSTKMVNMIKATADLGHYLQAYLDESNTSWSVENGDHAAIDKVYTENIEDYLAEATDAVADHALSATGSNSDIKKLTYKVNFESKMSIHIIVIMKSGFNGTLTATADGADCTVTQQTATKFLVEVPNVQAHQLSRKFEIAITTENGTLTLTGSALSYVKMMLEGANGNTVMQNAAIALYRYSKAADTVKGY